MTIELQKYIEQLCKTSAVEVSLSGFSDLVQVVYKDEYDHRIAALTRMLMKSMEQTAIYRGDHVVSSANDNAKEDTAELLLAGKVTT